MDLTTFKQGMAVMVRHFRHLPNILDWIPCVSLRSGPTQVAITSSDARVYDTYQARHARRQH